MDGPRCSGQEESAGERLGRTPAPPDLVASLREQMIDEMKAVFGSDRPRIDHAMKVLDNAEAILAAETADPLIAHAFKTAAGRALARERLLS